MPDMTQALHIIEFTKQQLDQNIHHETPFSSEQIFNALNLAQVQVFDWLMLDRDRDYKNYYCRGGDRYNLAPRDSFIFGTHSGGLATFNGYIRCGFLASDYQIRDTRSPDTGSAFIPDTADLIGASFKFNTAQDKTLYIRADAYDPWLACIFLTMGTPGQGYHGLKSQRIMQRNEQYALAEKHSMWKRLSLSLNKRMPSWGRA